MLQLEFFKTEEQLDIDQLYGQVADLKSSQDRVRRKLFAELCEAKKMLRETMEEFDTWKKTVCQEG